MSDDLQNAVPANRPDDCSTEQPPNDDAAFSVPPPNDEAETSDVVISSKDDGAASPAPPPNNDAGLEPPPNTDAGTVSPPNVEAGPSSPPNVEAGPSSQSMDDPAVLDPKDKPGCSKASGSAAEGDSEDGVVLKEGIKHEEIDLGTEPYYYDDDEDSKDSTSSESSKVGFDRGLEPDHIVGATEEDGKLKFLIAWKNSEVADLLEATTIYEKCPQIAIQFFEARLRYCTPTDN